LFVLCVAVPYSRHFFDLHFGPWYQWTTGLVIAAVACVLLEVLWRRFSAHSAGAAAPEPAEAV
jgi:hypothetical protein